MAEDVSRPAFATVQVTSRNPTLRKRLDSWQRRRLLSMNVRLGATAAVSSIELRRTRDDRLLGRIIPLNESREKLVDIDPELSVALQRQALDAISENGLILPSEADFERFRRLVRAIRPLLVTTGRNATPRRETVWDFLESEAGSIEAPADWSREHDHYIYGTPKRGESGGE